MRTPIFFSTVFLLLGAPVNSLQAQSAQAPEGSAAQEQVFLKNARQLIFEGVRSG
jgi:hypothetical protein